MLHIKPLTKILSPEKMTRLVVSVDIVIISLLIMFAGNEITSIAVDPNGMLWIGTLSWISLSFL